MDQTERERRIASHLRSIVTPHLELLGPEKAAEKLGVLPRYIEVLLWQSEWPLETAFRVADRLDLSIVGALEALVDHRAST